MKHLMLMCLSFFCLISPTANCCSIKTQSCSKANQNKELLVTFWEELFKTTSAGYAIYGEKPVYLGNFCHPEWLMPGSIEHKEANQRFLALRLLESCFNQNVQPTNCILVNRGKNLAYPYEFMLINQKALHEKINESASLFKYKLGWNTSSEEILENLISMGNSFLALFHGELALKGVLLGYGTENSISYERSSFFKSALTSTDPICPPNKLPFPPKMITNDLEESHFDKNPLWKKVREETKDFAPHYLQNREAGLNIFFSFHKNSSETQALIENYKKAQVKLDALFYKKKFLEEILENLGMSNQTSSIYENKMAQEFTNLEKKTLPQALAQVINYTFFNQISPEFFEGMKFADNINEDDIILNEQEMICFDISREQEFSIPLRKKNASLSREFLLKHAALKEMCCLVPEKLYTFSLIKGAQGKILTSKDRSVLANYLIKDIEGNIICGTHKGEPPKILDLESLIPGLAHGMLGMSEGEVREVYIHPDFAYGVYSNFGDGKAIVVQLELIKIETASNPPNFPCLQPIDFRHFAPKIQTCEEFDASQKKYSYHCGMMTWLHYKKAGNLLDLKTIMTHLQSNQLPLPSEKEREMIARLNWMIYQASPEHVESDW